MSTIFLRRQCSENFEAGIKLPWLKEFGFGDWRLALGLSVALTFQRPVARAIDLGCRSDRAGGLGDLL